MASNITVDTLTKGSTTLNTDEIVDTNSSQACKAWASYNGKDNVFYSAFNVSSRLLGAELSVLFIETLLAVKA